MVRSIRSGACWAKRIVGPVTSAELKRWLERQGATFEPAKGGHLWVRLRGRRAILPMHGSRKELKIGTVAAIKAARFAMRMRCVPIPRC